MSQPLSNTPQITNKSFCQGDTIFNEGDEGDCAYVVQSGRVEIFKGQKVLGAISKGGIFGEMALMDNSKRMASARAIGDTSLAVISRDIFEMKMSRTDPFVKGIMSVFVHNIRSMATSMVEESK